VGDAARQNANAFQLLSGKSLLLSELGLGDVFDHGKSVDRLAVGTMDNGCSKVDPDYLTAPLHIPLLDAVDRYVALEETLGKLNVRSHVIRVRNFGKGLLDEFRLFVTHHTTKGTVYLHETIVSSHKGETERTFFEDSTETLFTLAQRGFGRLALGDLETHTR